MEDVGFFWITNIHATKVQLMPTFWFVVLGALCRLLLLYWLQRALHSRDEGAMGRVGSMLMAGYGAKQDPEKTAQWMQEAW